MGRGSGLFFFVFVYIVFFLGRGRKSLGRGCVGGRVGWAEGSGNGVLAEVWVGGALARWSLTLGASPRRLRGHHGVLIAAL